MIADSNAASNANDVGEVVLIETTSVKGKLHWVECGLIIFAFAAPSACMGIPFAIGSNGLMLGSIVCLVSTLASMSGAFMLFELCLQFPDALQLSDLGAAVLGRKGQIGVGVLQLGNFLLFLPVALLTCADGLEGLWSGLSSRIDLYVLTVSGVCLLTTQVRDLGNTAPLAYFSAVSVLIIGALLVFFVHKHDNPDKEVPILFGNPQMHTEVGLYKCFLGFTTASWGYVPSFLTAELMSSMKCPKQYPRAILLSGALNIAFYIGIGVTVTTRWGSDLPDPVNISSPWVAHANDPLARIMALLLLLVNIISYSLDSVPLVRNFQRAWFPTFRDDYSTSSIFKYLGISLPSFALALGLALTVDNLFLMLAFVTCFTVPQVTQIVPSILYVKWRRTPMQQVCEIEDADGGGIRALTRNIPPGWTCERQVMVMFAFVYGVLNFIVCLLAAMGKAFILEPK